VGRAGADIMGVVLVEASPRFVPPEGAARLGQRAGVPHFIVVADLPLPRLLAWAEKSHAAGLQLHGSEPPELLRHLRAEGPWELWKAVRVREADEVARAMAEYRDVADLLLVDAWDPVRLGGTGRRIPASALGALADEGKREIPLGVAGGLDPGNVADVVTRLHPDAVDVSSGVEVAPGKKDPSRIRAFVAAVRAAQDD
jgi:phosphoribosylanthranilate isomerase